MLSLTYYKETTQNKIRNIDFKGIISKSLHAICIIINGYFIYGVNH